jgi:hypothetical protein
MKTIKLTIFLTILTVLFARQANAQSVSLSLTPPILEAVVKPGEEVSQLYTLTNDANESIFTSHIIPFSSSDEFGNVSLGKDLNEYDPFESRYWFHFNQSDVPLGQKFYLTKGERKNFNLSVKVPDDAPQGDYYFSLVFQTEPEGIGVKQGLVAQVKIASNILLTVSKDGLVDRQAKIEEFSAPKISDSFAPLYYKVRITNSGSSFFKPRGRIEISSWFGKKTLALAPLNITAKSTRQLYCLEKERIVPCGFGKGFLLGPYKAKLTFGIEGVNKSFEATAVSFAVPVYLFFAAGTVLAFFLSKKRIKK